MDAKKTGTLILEARKKQNLTQKELADKISISDKAVSKWERGLSFPDISMLIPLTEILNISLYELLTGEKTTESCVEETLKNTINYSNDKLKYRKKIYTIISSILIASIILISSISVVLFEKSKGETGGIIDRDTVYDITYYSDYYTSIQSADRDNLDFILKKLPLTFARKTYNTEKNNITIHYGISYSDIVAAYNDEFYVKLAMINIACILFATVNDIQTVEITYADYKFSVEKDSLQRIFNVSSFKEITSHKTWEKVISKKLKSVEFVNYAFEHFDEKNVKNNINNIGD